MFSLEIRFSGLCLLVPDRKEGAVHVLLPAVPGLHGSEPYAARLLGGDLQPEGRSIQGWSLVLGGTPGTADTTLTPISPAEGELLDLSSITGRKVPRRYLSGAGQPNLTARITLAAGRLTEVEAGSRWRIAGRELVLARSVTWRIDNVPDALAWTATGATGEPPVAFLAELGSPSGDTLRIRIYHGPAGASPTGEGVTPEDVEQGVRAHFRLLGLDHPGPEYMPARSPGEQTDLILGLTGVDDTDDWNARQQRGG